MFRVQAGSRLCRRLAGAATAWLLLCGASLPAFGAPFSGEAELGANKDPGKRRRAALVAARLAAFDAAVASLQSSVDATQLKLARASADMWTSSYRVLSMEGERVLVEAEIDLPRLRKRLTPASAAVQRQVALGDVSLDAACDAALAAPALWAEAMRGAGLPVVERAAHRIDVHLGCENLGPVMVTHLQAARVVLELQDSQGGRWRTEGFGFAVEAQQAQQGAMADALQDALPRVAADFSAPLIVRVKGVSDGSRVRRLGAAMEAGVVGADKVQVVGVEAGGAVHLAVQGGVELEALAASLRQLEFPDFRFEVKTDEQGTRVDVEIF